MKKRGPPSVVLIQPDSFWGSRSLSDDSTGVLSRGRQWLKGSLPVGKRKLDHRSSSLRRSSNTEDTDVLEFWQDFYAQRPESPQGETSEESEPIETKFEPLHTKLTVERIDESPLEEVEESEEWNIIQKAPETPSRRRYWVPIQGILFGHKEKRWPSMETEANWKEQKSTCSSEERNSVVNLKNELDMPDLSTKPKSWRPLQTKLFGSKEQRWSSIETEKEWRHANSKRNPTVQKGQRRNTMADLSNRMQRRNAIVLNGDDCKVLRKLVQTDSSEKRKSSKQKSKHNKGKRKQNRRRSSRSSASSKSSRSSSIIVRNFVGAESSNASIPKTIVAKTPKRVGPKTKVSFSSALIFLSGVITTVLATHMSAIIDEWLKSQTPEGVDWSKIFDDWVVSLMQGESTQNFIGLISE